MKRSEFFSVMGKGLLETVKEVASPFIAEDFDKLDSFVDELSGIKWFEAGAVKSLSVEGIHDLYINGTPIVVFFDKEQFSAFQKVCPECKTVPQWISFERKFKCFTCEKEYHVETGRGDLLLKKCPVKKMKGKLYIALQGKGM